MVVGRQETPAKVGGFKLITEIQRNKFMALDQTSHPIYKLDVDISNTSRLFEYYMLKDEIKKSDVVLDLGCNSGVGMDILSEFSDFVHGIDVVPELEGLLTEKYKNNDKVSWKIVEIGQFGYPENYFDIIVANNFIEHVEDPEFYLKSLKKLLKPKGVLVLTTVNRKLRLYSWGKPFNPHHYTEYSPNSLAKLVGKVFKEYELKGLVKGPPFFPDYVEIASKLKFDNGIKWPVLDFLKKIKRIFIPVKVVAEDGEGTSKESENVIVDHKVNISDFEEAFRSIQIDSNQPEKWAEMYVKCHKSE